MYLIRKIALLSCLILAPSRATEITYEQQLIYPRNPHIVQARFEDPSIRKIFADAVQTVVNPVRGISWGLKAAAACSLGILFGAKSTGGKVAGLGLGALCAGLGIGLDKLAQKFTDIVDSQKSITILPAPTTSDAHYLAPFDEIYFFYTPRCTLCESLCDKVSAAESAHSLLRFRFVVCEGAFLAFGLSHKNGPLGEHTHPMFLPQTDIVLNCMLQRMGVNVVSTPLVILVRDDVIVRIIIGYRNIEKFLEEVMKSRDTINKGLNYAM